MANYLPADLTAAQAAAAYSVQNGAIDALHPAMITACNALVTAMAAYAAPVAAQNATVALANRIAQQLSTAPSPVDGLPYQSTVFPQQYYANVTAMTQAYPRERFEAALRASMGDAAWAAFRSNLRSWI